MKESYKLHHGDCLEKMKLMKSKSVNLILIDPPYNIGINGEKWDKWETISSYVEFMGKVFKECERVLKDNGSFYFFHNDFLQIVELQNWLNKNSNFVFKNFINIKKMEGSYIIKKYASRKNFQSYVNNSEYLLYYTFVDIKNNNTNTYMSKIKNYFQEEKRKAELLYGELKNKLQWTKHFHSFSNGQSYGFPSEDSYKELQSNFKGFFDKEYSTFLPAFNCKEGKETSWEYYFNKEKKSGHPTQKPLKLLQDIINASSNEGDIVLDCFMGSGSCGVACINTNRKFIGIEMDDKYFQISKERIEEAVKASKKSK